MAAQHVEPSVPRQQTNYILGQAVTEIVGVGLLAQVHERQHRDGRFARGDYRRKCCTDDPLCCFRKFVSRSGRRFLNNANEAKSAPMDSLDQRLSIAIVADCSSGGVNTTAQCGLRHDTAIPDRVEQLVLSNHAIAVSHKMHQQVIDLRFDMNDPISTIQFPTMQVYRTLPEYEIGPALGARLLNAC